MSSRRMLFVAALAIVARPGTAQQPLRPIDLVADVTLDAVATAEGDSTHPVIRYNPVLMQRVGPEIGTFLLVHESAHLRLGHKPVAMPAGDDSGDSDEPTALQAQARAQELAADCLAAHMLAERSPSLLARLIGWFEAAGDDRPDAWRPSGAERAKRLSACSTNTRVQIG